MVSLTAEQGLLCLQPCCWLNPLPMGLAVSAWDCQLWATLSYGITSSLWEGMRVSPNLCSNEKKTVKLCGLILRIPRENLIQKFLKGIGIYITRGKNWSSLFLFLNFGVKPERNDNTLLSSCFSGMWPLSKPSTSSRADTKCVSMQTEPQTLNYSNKNWINMAFMRKPFIRGFHKKTVLDILGNFNLFPQTECCHRNHEIIHVWISAVICKWWSA